MPAESRAGVLPKAVIAALIGSVAGGTAGVWSLGRPAATTPATDVGAGSSPSPSLLKRVAPTPQPTRARTNAAASLAQDPAAPVAPLGAPAPSADDEAHVLQRARTLARRPDVTALMALRDDVVRRATERGIADSPSVQGELHELDQRLNEARRLQLKLDAEEFRKADSKGPR
jgi:hypothetical protein